MRTLPFVCLLAACAPEARRSAQVPMLATGAGAASFPAAGEVEVILAQALVTIADLRLESPPEVSLLSRLAPLRSAHAHPGHDFSGNVACELLGVWDLDLLGEPLDLGEATCLEGALATGRVLLSGDAVVVLEGEAVLPDDTVRAFAFELPLDEEVVGIPIDATIDPDDLLASITLTAQPATMLSWVDWNTEDADSDDLLTLSDGLLANTVPFGALSSSSWTLTPNP
ncbi:MAG: hypothetical protein ABIO70_03220 [Pseudomonadota bacterium]